MLLIVYNVSAERIGILVCLAHSWVFKAQNCALFVVGVSK